MEAKKPRTELIENVPLSVPEGTTEEVINEIIEVLKFTRFNKISVALAGYRRIYDESAAADDTRTITVGYIKKFDAESKTFTVVVYGNNAKTITEKYDKANLMVQAVFTQYKEKLGVITKLVLAPIV